jgi:hypothetical protein
MDKQNKINYLNEKCEVFQDCEGCPVQCSVIGSEVCSSYGFDVMTDVQLDYMVDLFKKDEIQSKTDETIASNDWLEDNNNR